jgi:hypothetical protein
MRTFQAFFLLMMNDSTFHMTLFAFFSISNVTNKWLRDVLTSVTDNWSYIFVRLRSITSARQIKMNISGTPVVKDAWGMVMVGLSSFVVTIICFLIVLSRQHSKEQPIVQSAQLSQWQQKVNSFTNVAYQPASDILLELGMSNIQPKHTILQQSHVWKNYSIMPLLFIDSYLKINFQCHEIFRLGRGCRSKCTCWYGC